MTTNILCASGFFTYEVIQSRESMKQVVAARFSNIHLFDVDVRDLAEDDKRNDKYVITNATGDNVVCATKNKNFFCWVFFRHV